MNSRISSVDTGGEWRDDQTGVEEAAVVHEQEGEKLDGDDTQGGDAEVDALARPSVVLDHLPRRNKDKADPEEDDDRDDHRKDVEDKRPRGRRLDDKEGVVLLVIPLCQTRQTDK